MSKSTDAEGTLLTELRELVAGLLASESGVAVHAIDATGAVPAEAAEFTRASNDPDFVDRATKLGLAGVIGANSPEPAWQVAYLDQAKQVLVQLAELRNAAHSFEAAGIQYLVYKGLPLAVRTTGDVVGRGAGDNDILISPAHLVHANEALLASGFAETFAITPRNSVATRLFAWIHNELHFSTFKADLDLHWRLHKSVGTTPNFEALLNRSVEIELGGVVMRTLGDEDSLVTMAYQFYGDGCQSLKQQVDIWRLWNRLPAERRVTVGEGLGYSNRLVQLTRAAIAHTAETFGFDAEGLRQTAGSLRFLQRIRQTATSGKPKEVASEQVSIMSVQQQLRNLEIQTGLGKRVSNLVRFTLDKLLDFRNQDLGNSVRSIFGAFWRELRTQVVGRLRLRATRKSQGTKRKPEAGKFLRTLALAAVTFWLLQAFVVKIYYVPSASMEPTLVTDGANSDRLLVGKFPLYSGLLKDGSIVVFNKPAAWQRQEAQSQVHSIGAVVSEFLGIGPGLRNHLVKRVIAHGGQVVSCCDLNGRLLVDGKPQPPMQFDYPFQKGVLDCSTTPESRRCFDTFTVPKGQYLVLGDNRANSNDSLAPCRVPVPAQRCARFVRESDLVGVVLGIAWPLNRLGAPQVAGVSQ